MAAFPKAAITGQSPCFLHDSSCRRTVPLPSYIRPIQSFKHRASHSRKPFSHLRPQHWKREARWIPARAQIEGLDEHIADYGVLTQKMQDLAAEVHGQLEGTSIYLVGMMGSGKSTVGKLVASALKYPFLDSDTLIEQLAGCTISDIFREEGEESFREVESQVLQELMPFKAVVVSTGGGAVVRRQNWGFMQHGVVVWLTGSPELLSRRALRDGTATRPLLSQNNGQAKGTGDEYTAAVDRMRNILAERQRAYSMADLQIPLETSPSDPGDVGAAPAVVAYRVLKALSERLKRDAAARDAAKDFEIKQSGEVPPSMRVMPSRGESAATSTEEWNTGHKRLS